MTVHVIFIKDKIDEVVEISANVNGREFFAQETSDLFEKSLGGAIDKMVIQLKKHHDKVTGKIKTRVKQELDE